MILSFQIVDFGLGLFYVYLLMVKVVFSSEDQTQVLKHAKHTPYP